MDHYMSTAQQADSPPISIIIPVYNRTEYAKVAIKSALAQTYPNIEVIVVDDGSSDGTYETLVALDLPIVLLQNKVNKGPAGSRNAGIKVSRGEYLFFLDSDDALEKDGVTSLYEALRRKEQESSQWGVAYGKLLTCNAKLEPVPVKPKKYYTGDILAYLLQDNPVRTGSYLIRKEIVEKVGGFYEELHDHEDFLFYCLVATRYKFTFIDKYISRFRRHTGDRARHNYPKILKANIVHLDYFFKKSSNLKPEILALKNKLYASEHLRMAKIGWRISQPKDYLFHWQKMLHYRPTSIFHPKYTIRALLSALRA